MSDDEEETGDSMRCVPLPSKADAGRQERITAAISEFNSPQTVGDDDRVESE